MIDSVRDFRTYNLPLTNSPIPIFLISAGYLLFVFRLGPALMKNRPAYNLKWVLVFYNGFQVAINSWMAVKGLFLLLAYWPYSDFKCMVALPKSHSLHSHELELTYTYYLLKFLDLFDTVFFVLRKNHKQISFLHCYHHVMMIITGYIFLRFIGYGGHGISLGVLNLIVHSIMYSYYFVSSLSPESKRYLWWKKYITLAQMTQFVLLTLHQLLPFTVKDCQYPRIGNLLFILQSVVMLVLFSNFYYHAYIKNGRQTVRKNK